MRLSINSIEYYLPESIVSNEDLKLSNPEWDIDKVADKSGVLRRHIAEDDETAYDLALRACSKLKEKNGLDDIDGIIFCTQSPDYIMPSNSFLLHRDLGLNRDVFCFDFNHACTGYIYSLKMAQAFMKSNMSEKILLVNADTYSKYINPKDRSTRVLFGDAAAVTLVEKESNGIGIIDIDVGSDGNGWDKFWIEAGGLRSPRSEDTIIESKDHQGNIKTKEDIAMDGMGVWSFINSVAPKQIKLMLERNSLTINEIDQIIFHQASQMTLDSIIRALKIDDSKVFVNIGSIGNTVSASIPIALKDAIDSGKVKRGSKIILSGFGVGLSYGSILMEY